MEPAGRADNPPLPFLDPALPGKEESVLQAGGESCDQSVCEMHESAKAEEEEHEDSKRGPGEAGLGRPLHPAPSPGPQGGRSVLTLSAQLRGWLLRSQYHPRFS